MKYRLTSRQILRNDGYGIEVRLVYKNMNDLSEYYPAPMDNNKVMKAFDSVENLDFSKEQKPELEIKETSKEKQPIQSLNIDDYDKPLYNYNIERIDENNEEVEFWKDVFVTIAPIVGNNSEITVGDIGSFANDAVRLLRNVKEKGIK